MQIKSQIAPLAKVKCDLLAVAVFKDAKTLPPELAALDRTLGGALQTGIKQGDLARKGSGYWFYTSKKAAATRVLIMNLGLRKEYDDEKLRQAVHQVITLARRLRVAHLALGHLAIEESKWPLAEAAHKVAETCLLAHYKYDAFTKKKETDDEDADRPIETVALVSAHASTQKALNQGIRSGTVYGSATNFARDLVNGPRNHVTPDAFLEKARKIARRPGMTLKVFNTAQLKKMGAGCFCGVAQGSDNPAYMLVLEYRHNQKNPPVAFVGKGITFDTGGISIKPSTKMRDMKMDMAGAAAVLGAMLAISELKPKENVIGVMALSENMPSGHAYTPGDILKALNGKTVEINSTDAEGRLVLADALTYTARTYKPKYMVDLATLTGACRTALGTYRAGLMTNHQATADQIMQAAERAGERYWQLPLDKAYKKLLKSKYADLMNNSDSGLAGTISAAAFLQEFVEKTHWAHLDIAGPGMENEGVFDYMDKTATGFGVRTLLRLLG